MSALCVQLEDKDKNYDNNDNDACSSKIQSDGGTNYSSWLTVASASVHQVRFPSIELYFLFNKMSFLKFFDSENYRIRTTKFDFEG